MFSIWTYYISVTDTYLSWPSADINDEEADEAEADTG